MVKKRQTKKTVGTAIRDRIVDFRRVKAGELKDHPHNWRTHPEGQRSALRGLLEEVGYADALLAREVDGGLELIDGHLRKELTPDQEVPVLVLDVDEAEAKKLLATLDPLSAMAEVSTEKLEALVKELKTNSPGVQAMLDDLAGSQPANREEAENETTASVMDDLEFRVIVLCRDENHQKELLERFEKEGIECRPAPAPLCATG